jgi:hypothetical protein
MLLDGVNAVRPLENVILGALALREKDRSEEKPLPTGKNEVAVGENGRVLAENDVGEVTE